jgi:hypothetical protein
MEIVAVLMELYCKRFILNEIPNICSFLPAVLLLLLLRIGSAFKS